ncbi:MAG: biotin/lipoyl-binding protein [Lachnospiraceae bacterium]|nr:biotin/lipoyl-binding protein [Lachnospiraceae bacterium]
MAKVTVSKKKIIAAAAGAILIAAAGIGTYKLTAGSAVKVQKAAVTRLAVRDTYTQEGKLSAGGRYQVLSEVSGAVAEICVKENDAVHAGDLLYRIDDSNYRYSKEQAENAVAGLEAQLEASRIGQMMTSSPTEYLQSLQKETEAARAAFQTAQTSYNAAQALYAAGDISLVEYEQLAAQYRSAQAAYDQARQRSEQSASYLQKLEAEGIDQETINEQFYGSETRQLEAQINGQKAGISQLADMIRKCEVRADRDGRVVSLPVKDLSMVQPGQLCLEMSGMEEAAAEADVLTSIAPYLAVGDPVEVKLTLRGRDEIWKGSISEVYDYAEKGISALGLDEYRVHVKARIENSGSLENSTGPDADAAATPGSSSPLWSRDGYGVDMTFTLFDEADALTVPSGAVFTAEGVDYVYAVESGRAVRKKITVEYKSASLVVLDESASEVHEGDTVIDQVDTKGIYEGVSLR